MQFHALVVQFWHQSLDHLQRSMRRTETMGSETGTSHNVLLMMMTVTSVQVGVHMLLSKLESVRVVSE